MTWHLRAVKSHYLELGIRLVFAKHSNTRRLPSVDRSLQLSSFIPFAIDIMRTWLGCVQKSCNHDENVDKPPAVRFSKNLSKKYRFRPRSFIVNGISFIDLMLRPDCANSKQPWTCMNEAATNIILYTYRCAVTSMKAKYKAPACCNLIRRREETIFTAYMPGQTGHENKRLFDCWTNVRTKLIE